LHFSKQHFSFLVANLSYLLSGKFKTNLGNEPTPDHPVPADFSCVAVAAAEETGTDAYLIERLEALAVKRVRIDFTPEDFGSATERLLTALLKTQLKVHLHLVQPFKQAQAMQTAQAQNDWRGFLQEVCEHYGKQVALIEVGSTVNRKRWAGYDLSRLLIMWQISHAVIKQYDITLAGPNVTDFEPVYNIGLLNLFKQTQTLPDIHTNNLFSERCTEPERNDHKIMGRRLAILSRFRLIKKAHVIDCIGQHYGVKDWHSPAAFWTLPRIARILPDSEAKQADYLIRYMVLCAASGTMQSAGWGPLICHREGLISDQIKTYPTLERITHYSDIGSDPDTYQQRPSFDAFKQFNQALQGADYLEQVPCEDGLEVHAFHTTTGPCHVAWTINGKAARLTDVYTNLTAIAECVNRDGQVVMTPDFISESPIYLYFSQKPELQSHPAPIKDLAIYRQMPNTEYFSYSHGQWRGVISARDQAEFTYLSTTLNPENLQGPDKASTLRKARNAIWTIDDPRDASKKLVIKQPIKVPWYKKITDYYKPSKALRSWSGANELLRRGISNAKPIAYFEHTDDASRTQNFYLCEYVKSDFSARTLFTSFAKGETSFMGLAKDDAIKQVQEFLFNMHQRGVFFRDLSGGNILIKLNKDNRLNFSLIDTGRAHFFNHPTAMAKRLSDMARACNKLNTASRNQLMQQYMGKTNKPYGWRAKLPFVLYNIKVSVKRQTKLKNILKRFGLKKKLD